MNEVTPHVIKGGYYTDDRGALEFYNEFDMTQVKRVYFTTHFDPNVIRAWQGHTIESRWFCSVKGSFHVKLIKIDDWEKPSDQLKVLEYELTSEEQEILFIPNGFLNGFKAIQSDSKLMIMSNYALGEIENDELRFDEKKWSKWVI
jgi:dTDP-4-dehydrorhamnose 3,5-epimerase-like enzyme